MGDTGVIQIGAGFSISFRYRILWPQKGPGLWLSFQRNYLLGRSVFGDSLGALGHGVLGKLTGKKQPDGGLDFPRSDGGSLVVVGQTGSFSGDSFENIVDERVHDGHGLGGDTSVGVHLLEHLVDVDGVRFTPLLPSLLITLGDGFLGLTGLLGGLSRSFRRHGESIYDEQRRF